MKKFVKSANSAKRWKARSSRPDAFYGKMEDLSVS
jgi:hypothetical protein